MWVVVQHILLQRHLLIEQELEPFFNSYLLVGKLFAYNEGIALLQYIRQRSFIKIFATQNVEIDCPNIIFEPGLQVLVGMLVVPLELSGADFLVFFRNTKEGKSHGQGIRMRNLSALKRQLILNLEAHSDDGLSKWLARAESGLKIKVSKISKLPF